ncbi:MAG TPA: hypothetical protein VKS19_06900, partial [Verrucomicrobiae bacterium]|nr:hypothetical protein [Verrucomicrobiae bacterium]
IANARFRNVFACCLLSGLPGFTPVVSAQPTLFGGNPDTSAFLRIPPDTDDWTRHFHIGALVGMNISANFSMNGTFGISGNNPSQGIFDNGYVRTDNTGNAFGQTGYWGYKDPSQVSGSTLTMDAATSFSASHSAKESGGVFPGFEMAYGGNLWYWKHARVGWELGFGLLPISITDNESMPASVNQLSYTFDTGGIVVPNAPYQGGFNRDGEPTIQVPLNITPSGTNSIPNGMVTGSQKLDVMLYTLRLGPTMYWDLTDHISLSLGAGPAVGVVSGDYKFDETITASGVSAHNSGQIGGTDFVYGGYVNATVLCHVMDNGDIFAGAQFMPMSDATISGQGRSGRLNLGGQVYFTVGINWPF